MALFTPFGVKGGPKRENLLPTRVTRMTFAGWGGEGKSVALALDGETRIVGQILPLAIVRTTLDGPERLVSLRKDAGIASQSPKATTRLTVPTGTIPLAHSPVRPPKS